eukprot:8427787-Alexandrium_andersonii.AAC.1
MQQRLVQDCFAKLAAVSFNIVPGDLLELLRDAFSTPPTKVVEDGFQKERVQETRHQDNKVVSRARRWAAPIETK